MVAALAPSAGPPVDLDVRVGPGGPRDGSRGTLGERGASRLVWRITPVALITGTMP